MTYLDLNNPTSRVWMVRRILAREIESEMAARKSLIAVHDLKMPSSTYTMASDDLLIEKLRSDRNLLDGPNGIQQAWFQKIQLRDKAIHICQELRFSVEDTEQILNLIGL